MNFLSLLASGSGSLSEGTIDSLVSTAYSKFAEVVGTVMPIVLSVVLLFGVIYGIVLGVKFAKAEDAEGRDKAKTQLINMIIGVLVALVIIIVVYAILNSSWVESFFKDKTDKTSK